MTSRADAALIAHLDQRIADLEYYNGYLETMNNELRRQLRVAVGVRKEGEEDPIPIPEKKITRRRFLRGNR